MDSSYTREYIKEHMDDFSAFVDAARLGKYDGFHTSDLTIDVLATLYISMKRST